MSLIFKDVAGEWPINLVRVCFHLDFAKMIILVLVSGFRFR